jgi:hypothetical protein
MFIDYDTLFYFVDNFCMSFEVWYKKQLLSEGKIKRDRCCQLKLSEVLTILLAYHQSGMACFKYFYFYVLRYHRHLFPNLVSYSRFIVLVKRSFAPLLCMLKSLQGEITEYLFIDSTPMPVCHNLRINRHRTFQGLAERGKTSTGWFYGFKLHMLFNTKGEIVRLHITPGNTDDRKPVPDMLKDIVAKLIGDKGYLSQKLFDQLFDKGVTLITKIKKRMKNRLMDITDKMMLRKRGFIETIFSSLKSLNTLIHHRHRCPINAFTHLIAGLINYQLRNDKPHINIS